MSQVTTFGQWLKQRRKVLGLTQKDLAQQVGCAEVTLRKIEAGNLLPSAPLVASLARALGTADANLPNLVSLARSGDDFTAKPRLLRLQRPNNLAAQLTPLIGRERDITAVRKRLLSDGARLITLLGPPGVGKTRLAQAVAEDVLEHFEHGAFFVRLGPVSDPALVASAVAQALGLQMTGSTPPVLQLRAYLEEKHLLLVLDNFEQVIEAAPLVDDLLRRCPWLHILVTSRQPMRVRGERQMTVRPLAVPVEPPDASQITAANALRFPAVALFAERAEAVQPDFTVTDSNAPAVAELCRRLDGLPLAIELIAARIKLLPPAELLTRLSGSWLLSVDGLRDVSTRQKTLRGAVGWSYDLLSPVEQALMRRLAVFADGWSLDAAEAVCGENKSELPPSVVSPHPILDGLTSLLDKSMVQQVEGLSAEPRFRMLVTIRAFAAEKLTAHGEADRTGQRHAAYYAEVAETADVELHGPQQVAWLARLEADIHNLRAALRWAVRSDRDLSLQLAGALGYFWIVRGYLSEGRRWFTQILDQAGPASPIRARALEAAASLAHYEGDNKQAVLLAKQGLAISIEAGAARSEVVLRLLLAKIASYQGDTVYAESQYEEAQSIADHMSGPHQIRLRALTLAFHGDEALANDDYATATRLFEQSLALHRQGGDLWGIGMGLYRLARVTQQRQKYDQAVVLYQGALVYLRKVGEIPYLAYSLVGLAHTLIQRGEVDQAAQLLQESLALGRERAFNHIITLSLVGLGTVAWQRGELDRASGFLAEGIHIAAQIGDKVHLAYSRQRLADVCAAKGDFARAESLYRESLQDLEASSHCSSVARALRGLAAVALARHDETRAARLLGAATAVCRNTTTALQPLEQATLAPTLAMVQQCLEEHRFATAYAEGMAMTVDQAIAYASWK